jgi:transcriptional regulator with GAF, ATPase, and Fis domain
LLDEIGEMALPAQVRLLRVLQHREIERVGGTDRVRVDVRIITATNKDLPAMVRTGRFREDLWFRLNVFPIEVPPLRERKSDIPALVQHFIEHKAGELKIGATPLGPRRRRP